MRMQNKNTEHCKLLFWSRNVVGGKITKKPTSLPIGDHGAVEWASKNFLTNLSITA